MMGNKESRDRSHPHSGVMCEDRGRDHVLSNPRSTCRTGQQPWGSQETCLDVTTDSFLERRPLQTDAGTLTPAGALLWGLLGDSGATVESWEPHDLRSTPYLLGDHGRAHTRRLVQAALWQG